MCLGKGLHKGRQKCAGKKKNAVSLLVLRFVLHFPVAVIAVMCCRIRGPKARATDVMFDAATMRKNPRLLTSGSDSQEINLNSQTCQLLSLFQG